MAKKKSTKPQKNPEAKITCKKINDYLYEIDDPVTGGKWAYDALREKSDAELLQAIITYMLFFNVKRPAKGQLIYFTQIIPD